jgi:UDP:flavonoid glycosyltransferase YjiC (YdhE family)
MGVSPSGVFGCVSNRDPIAVTIPRCHNMFERQAKARKSIACEQTELLGAIMGMQRRFVFLGVGTTGDVLPLLAMAGEMSRRGHECHLLANEPFAAQAHAADVGFVPIAPKQSNNVVDLKHNLGTYLFPSYAPTYEFFRRTESSSTRTVVVDLDYISATSSLSELYDLEVCRLFLCPFRVRSFQSPCWPAKGYLRGPLGRTFAKYTMSQVEKSWEPSGWLMSKINGYRAAWGLPPLESVPFIHESVKATVGMFPRWYCDLGADWPEGFQHLGFPLPPSEGRAPQDLEHFVSRHGAPLVFTPGTGVPDVDAFFSHAARCCERLRKPGLFLSHYAKQEIGAYGPNVLALPYVDMAVVLRKAALLVHHGGIGTTARALEAGVPQIISPLAYDQPDNGHRIESMGVGKVIERPLLDGDSLAQAASQLLQSSEVSQRLTECSRKVRESDSIAMLADYLEARFIRNSLAHRHARYHGAMNAVPDIGSVASRVSC